MHKHTGAAISGLDHLKQRVQDILTTPLGSRVMRRDYGSLLPSLIDQPLNAATRVRIYAAVATALSQWEPQLNLSRVKLFDGARPGQSVLDLEGDYITAIGTQPISLQVDLGRITS
jgi:phage baseplate assembly protein W